MPSSPWSRSVRRRYAGAGVLAILAVVSLLLPASDAVSRDAHAPDEGAPPVRRDPESKLIRAAEIRADLDAGAARTRVIVNVVPSPALAAFDAFDDRSALPAHRDEVARVVDTVLARLGPDAFEVTRRYDHLASFAGLATENALDALLASPDVDSVEPDDLLEVTTRQGIPQMAASLPRTSFGGAGVSVAVADTGIDYGHPDLGGGGFPNEKVIGGFDFGDDDPDPMDLHGHGTAVAGIAAGDLADEGDYIGGVAPEARLYALKISLGSGGSAFTSDMIAAWDWCITHKDDDPEHPILVVNTSFSDGQRYLSTCNGTTPAQTESASNLAEAGIALFCSNGNDGYCDGISKPACITTCIGVGAVYDANLGGIGWCVESPSCVGVPSACSTGFQCNDFTTGQDQVTCYSNSAEFMDVLAPSNDARAPAAGGGYTGFGGTSAASPYAAGAGAVIQSASLATFGTFLSVEDLRTLLVDHGDPVLDAKSGVTAPRVNLQNSVNALVPMNDGCADADPISEGATPFSNVAATTDGPEEPACVKSGQTQIESDVWFCYTAWCTGTATASTCDADFDTQIAVYDGCDCPIGESPVTCNDDSCGVQSSVSFPVVYGNDYLIRVGGFGGAQGSGVLDVSCVPANDDCANATPVGEGDFSLSNIGASTDGPDEPGACGAGGDSRIEADVWYRYTASCDGQATVDLCASSFDTKVAVYAGSDCPESAAAIACDDDGCGDRSRVTFDVTAGEEYLVRIGGAGGEQGTGNAALTCRASFDDCEEPGLLAAPSTGFSTLGATTDGPAEPGACSKEGDDQIGSDIWLAYTAACTGTVTLGLCDSDFDTKVAVYGGTGCPSSGTAVACNDDSCGVQSELSFVASSGEIYLVRVGGFEGAQGTGTITVECTPSVIDDCQGVDGVNTLRVNFDDGVGSGHAVAVEAGGPIFFDIAKPEAGGNGKFMVHMNAGAPSPETTITLPGSLGPFCFEALLGDGASPVSVWNNIGKKDLIDCSNFFGTPIPDPERAPTTFLLLPSGDPNLPVGSVFTLQGVIINPEATSPKGASVTNAILLLFE